jgi:hypothetical protein
MLAATEILRIEKKQCKNMKSDKDLSKHIVYVVSMKKNLQFTFTGIHQFLEGYKKKIHPMEIRSIGKTQF